MFSCKKPPAVIVVTDPLKYMPTLIFDGQDNFDSGEKSFPVRYDFNPNQDANGDSNLDQEDNLENYVHYKIGNDVTGTGISGLANRGPNDQRPAVYFHRAKVQPAANTSFTVYEYWFYYPHNDWFISHEHDWQAYFVYVNDSSSSTKPWYIMLNGDTRISWGNPDKDDDHPVLGVDGGSHTMKDADEDGVQIRYNGEITKNNGQLQQGNGETVPWVIYSNDALVSSNTVPFSTTPNFFFLGDPHYGSNDIGSNYMNAPWHRPEWDNPPEP